MNQKSPVQRTVSRLLLLAFSMVTTVFASAASFHEGDEIKLTRDESLYFRGQIFRQGMSGETFSVLSHHPEIRKVFVNANDKGKQIAVSISEDAVTLVLKDTMELRSEAIASARGGQFPEALRLISQAIRSDPQDVRVLQTLMAISNVQTASVELERAKTEQRRILIEGVRVRKNAAVVDRPNPLDPRDTSNHQRAEIMRKSADTADAAAKISVVNGQDAFDSAMALLNAL
jgi:hypothetical protein